MSAPSPMCRTAIFIVALLSVLAPFAHADAAVTPAGSHKKAATGDRADHAREHRVASERRSAAHLRRAETWRRSELRRREPRRRASVREPHRAHGERVSGRREEAYRAGRRKFERETRASQTRERADRRYRDRHFGNRRSAAEELSARRSPDGRRHGHSLHAVQAADDGTRAVPAPAEDRSPRDAQANYAAPASAGISDGEDYGRIPAAERADWTRELARGGMIPPLRGSLALLERQDERLEADGLERIQDEEDLSARIAHHLLVPLPVSAALTVDQDLPLHHRYCRPWTARFLVDLARAHEAVFHRPLEVSSAVRPVAYQARLMRINGNAAPAVGAIFSPHIMGATIDIAKKQMTRDEIAWMRRRLLTIELTGKIDVEEEFEQACFHITVYKSYAPDAGRAYIHSDRAAATENANSAGMM